MDQCSIIEFQKISITILRRVIGNCKGVGVGLNCFVVLFLFLFCFVLFFVSFRFVSFRFVSFRFVSYRFVLFCFVLFFFLFLFFFCFVLYFTWYMCETKVEFPGGGGGGLNQKSLCGRGMLWKTKLGRSSLAPFWRFDCILKSFHFHLQIRCDTGIAKRFSLCTIPCRYHDHLIPSLAFIVCE